MVGKISSRASQNLRVGYIIFDILKVIVMFLKREDQIHPNLLGWWSYSENRVKKHCREHEVEMLEKHQSGVETHVSHSSQCYCIPTLAMLQSDGLFICLTLPLDCELCGGRSSMSLIDRPTWHVLRVWCSHQTSVNLTLDRICGCQCVLCMFYAPFLELLHSLVLRYRNFLKVDLISP